MSVLSNTRQLDSTLFVFLLSVVSFGLSLKKKKVESVSAESSVVFLRHSRIFPVDFLAINTHFHQEMSCLNCTLILRDSLSAWPGFC